MKFKNIKSIEYYRWEKHVLCPGALWHKAYFVENNQIQIDYIGIYDWKKAFTQRNTQDLSWIQGFRNENRR